MSEVIELPSDAWLVTSTGAKLFYRDFLPKQNTSLPPLLCLQGFMRNLRDFWDLGARHQGLRTSAPPGQTGITHGDFSSTGTGKSLN